jgi:hypothetical protein
MNVLDLLSRCRARLIQSRPLAGYWAVIVRYFTSFSGFASAFKLLGA